MALRTLRLQKGWSQEHLAHLCNLSIRTIQRIEQGEKPSLETLNALAAVFNISIQDLQTPETEDKEMSGHEKERRKARRHVRKLKKFYSHLICYGVVIVALGIINLIMQASSFWVLWPAIGWGIGIFIHWFTAFKPFKLFSSEWHKKQVDKKLQ